MNYYFAIDLKTFYASCEIKERKLDILKTNLVVADISRGNNTICLAISENMKRLGIKNRSRLYEIKLDKDFIIAKPRMSLYIKYACDIYEFYLRYFSKDDIYVYSIDEVFIDVTHYLTMYNKTPYELSIFILKMLEENIGLKACCGIGTNMFLAKVALDIKAKKSSDFVYYLDEEKFICEFSYHTPLSDFWNIGVNTERRLNNLGLFNLKDVRECSEDILYKEFGKNALYLIDHSKGIEPCTIFDVKNYKKKDKSFCKSQILFRDYNKDESIIIIKEMAYELCVNLSVSKYYIKCISIAIGFSDRVTKRKSKTLLSFTNDYNILVNHLIELFLDIFDNDNFVRQIAISFSRVTDYNNFQPDLFFNDALDKKTTNLNKTILDIKKKFGKNSLVKAIDLEEGANTIERNKQIGGHNA